MSDAQIITPTGVLSFPGFFESRAAVEGAEPRYEGTLILDKTAQGSDEFRKLKEAIAKAAKDKWPNQMPKGLRSPIRDCAEKPDYEGFDEGKVFFRAWSKSRPGLIDNRKQKILVPDDVWAGQLARFAVRPFAYDVSGNRGVLLALDHVLIVKKDMPRIDGRSSPENVFKDVASDELDNADAEGDFV
jgi:hypothetical protein